jgi:hypothetical protein
MGLQEIGSAGVAYNVRLCKATLHVLLCVKKHTGFTEAFFTSITSDSHDIHTNRSLTTPAVRALPHPAPISTEFPNEQQSSSSSAVRRSLFPNLL